LYIDKDGKKVVELGDLGTRNYFAKEFNKEKEEILISFLVTQINKVIAEYEDKDTRRRSIITLVNYYLDTRRDILEERSKLNPTKIYVDKMKLE